jgi:hypothetical protein
MGIKQDQSPPEAIAVKFLINFRGGYHVISFLFDLFLFDLFLFDLFLLDFI